MSAEDLKVAQDEITWYLMVSEKVRGSPASERWALRGAIEAGMRAARLEEQV